MTQVSYDFLKSHPYLIMSSSPIILARGLSEDNKINLIIGILTIVIGILSSILAWATWRLTGDRRRRLGHQSQPFFQFLN